MKIFRSSALRRWLVPAVILCLFVGGMANASQGDVHGTSLTFLWIALLLILAKSASLVERWGQPAVLGELVAGVILGNLALVGIHTFQPILDDTFIKFLAELGVVILLFQIGLESNIQKMRAVGSRALLVATVGVIVPFALATLVAGPLLLPGQPLNVYLFLGAALTATSVGITARVFQDLGKLHLPEAQIVLGAAVIDDVLGLIILAVVSAIATTGSISVGTIGIITFKALIFLIGAIVIGQFAAPRLGHLFSKIHTGLGMKLGLALSFGLIFAWLASIVGLAPIVGAFAAGLILDPVHFRFFQGPSVVERIRKSLNGNPANQQITHALEECEEKHVEDLVQPIGQFLIPLFFVVTGMGVKLDTLFNPSIIFTALAITVIAFIGKLVSGLAAGNVRKSLVGWGMAPRGEVGLIFASTGKLLGVINDEVFSIIIVMVILTTLITPVVLTWILKRPEPSNSPETQPVTA